MMIVYPNLLPKPSRLATSAYTGGVSPIISNSPTNLFGRSKSFFTPPVGPGGLGRDAGGNKRHGNVNLTHPMNTMQPVATKTPEVARVQFHQTYQLPINKVPEIQPHEHGSFFTSKQFPVVRTVGGASKSMKSDTPFHPLKHGDPNKPKKLPRPTPTSINNNEKVKHVSFPSNNNLWSDPNNSYLKGQVNPTTGKVGVGRWQITKRSVV